MDAAAVTAQNRIYWEAIAPGRTGEPAEFFLDGGCVLTEPELDAIGDPAGLRVLQLACSVGDEAISLAARGARPVGVDLSPTHLATGRAKAAAVGVEVELREGDLIALEDELVGFDLIMISGGGLCWVPDLDAWAADVARRLAPGGRLLINEHHPLWEILTVAGPDRLKVSDDYFQGPREGYQEDPLKAPQVTWGRTDPLPEPISFVWSLGRVVSAVLGAGLTVRALREFAQPELYPGFDHAAALPASYLLMAEL